MKTYKETLQKASKENKIPLVVFVEKGSRKPILMCNLYDLSNILSHLIKLPPKSRDFGFLR